MKLKLSRKDLSPLSRSARCSVSADPTRALWPSAFQSPYHPTPNWDSPQTVALARTACFDCQSNEVVWPRYSNVAPFSWLAQRDVDEGRSKLNYAAMDLRQAIREIVEVVSEGEMPPLQCTLIHKDARLSAAERQALVDGFRAMFRR